MNRFFSKLDVQLISIWANAMYSSGRNRNGLNLTQTLPSFITPRSAIDLYILNLISKFEVKHKAAFNQ